MVIHPSLRPEKANGKRKVVTWPVIRNHSAEGRPYNQPTMPESSDPKLVTVRYYYQEPCLWKCSICQQRFSAHDVTGIYVTFRDMLELFRKHCSHEHSRQLRKVQSEPTCRAPLCVRSKKSNGLRRRGANAAYRDELQRFDKKLPSAPTFSTEGIALRLPVALSSVLHPRTLKHAKRRQEEC
jgi:hypothetical protein